MEYIRKCNVCGKIYCFTDEDVNNNMGNAVMSAVSAIGGVASVLSGNLFGAALSNNQTQNYGNKVFDFTRCPNCGSRNTDFVSSATTMAKTEQGQKPLIDEEDEDAVAVRQELLEAGVLSQEELNNMSDDEVLMFYLENPL